MTCRSQMSHHGAVACPEKATSPRACAAASVQHSFALFAVAVSEVAGQSFDPFSSRAAVRQCPVSAAVAALRMVFPFRSAGSTLSLVVFICSCFSWSCKASSRKCSCSPFSAEVRRFSVTCKMKWGVMWASLQHTQSPCRSSCVLSGCMALSKDCNLSAAHLSHHRNPLDIARSASASHRGRCR